MIHNWHIIYNENTKIINIYIYIYILFPYELCYIYLYINELPFVDNFQFFPMTSIPTPSSPLADEDFDDDDDDSSSVYGKTIKRIIQRAQSIPNQNNSSTLPVPSFFSQSRQSTLLRRSRAPISKSQQTTPNDEPQYSPGPARIAASQDRQSISTVDQLQQMHNYAQPSGETRSMYSIYEYAPSLANYHLDLASQCETSFMGDDNIELSSMTENHTFDLFSAPRGTGLLESNRARVPLYQRRYNSRSVDGIANCNIADLNTQYIVDKSESDERNDDDSSSESSQDSQPDMNMIWSWKSLKREFKLTQSENLFHLYQAKLQHSFFVALLILNTIFYICAIISHMISQHIVDNCKYAINWPYTRTHIERYCDLRYYLYRDKID